MSANYEVTLVIKKNGNKIVERISSIVCAENESVDISHGDDADTSTFTNRTAGNLAMINFGYITGDQDEFVTRLDGQSSAGLNLNAGGWACFFDAKIDAGVTTNVTTNVNGATLQLKMELGGTT